MNHKQSDCPVWVWDW